jgi:hypothetical protein
MQNEKKIIIIHPDQTGTFQRVLNTGKHAESLSKKLYLVFLNRENLVTAEP